MFVYSRTIFEIFIEIETLRIVFIWERCRKFSFLDSHPQRDVHLREIYSRAIRNSFILNWACIFRIQTTEIATFNGHCLENYCRAITLLTWYLPAQKNNSTGFLRSSKFEIRVQIFFPNWHLVNDNWLKSNEFISDLPRHLLYTLHWDNNLVILTLNTVSMFTKKYSYNSLSN